MAFIINDTVYRNLEEQVQKNKEDIAEHRKITSVLADLGINIYGRVDSYDILLTLPTDTRVYGDAYLVGTAEPYELYVWTRPDPNVGQETAYWLDVGPISVAGPEGAAGASVSGAGITQDGRLQMTLTNGRTIIAQGPSLIGPKGSSGSDGLTPEITTSASAAGTTVTIKTGTKSQSFFIQNGKDGGSGPVGPAGKPGSFTIRGVLYNIDLLPEAATAAPGDAYFVYDGVGQMPYNFYVVVTPDPADTSTYKWQEIGKITSGTVVKVNGSIVEEWNANTKLDKVSTTYGYPRAYTVNKAGQQELVNIMDNNLTKGSIVARGTGGIIKAGYPSAIDDAATKQYVDYVVSKLPSGGGGGGGGRFLSENLYFYEGSGSNISQYAEFGAIARAKIFWVQLNGFTNGPFFRDSEYNAATGKVIIPDQSNTLNVGGISITGGSEGSSQYQISIMDSDGGSFYDAYQWSDNKIIAFTDEQ